MKKLLFTAAIVAFGFTNINAQEEGSFGFAEGDLFVEGTLGLSSTNDKNADAKTSQFNFSPKGGYFLSDDLAIGAQFNFGSGKETVSNLITNEYSNTGVAVFGRYYFLDLGKRFKTFTELGMGFNTQNNKSADYKVNTFGIGLDLGLNYFVKENIALTFSLDNLLGYATSKTDIDGDKGANEFNLGLGEVNNPFGGTANFGVLFKF